METSPPTLPDFQERVIREHLDLDERFKRLHSFVFHNEVFRTLPIPEQTDLELQLSGMRVYLEALARRRTRMINSYIEANGFPAWAAEFARIREKAPKC